MFCFALACARAGCVDRGLVREVSWPVFPFVIGLFVVIGGVENLGLTGYLAVWLGRLDSHPLAQLAVVAGGLGWPPTSSTTYPPRC
jgi:Na+/H+ antiporter NhaD/arsenite permease-like protein